MPTNEDKAIEGKSAESHGRRARVGGDLDPARLTGAAMRTRSREERGAQAPSVKPTPAVNRLRSTRGTLSN